MSRGSAGAVHRRSSFGLAGRRPAYQHRQPIHLHRLSLPPITPTCLSGGVRIPGRRDPCCPARCSRRWRACSGRPTGCTARAWSRTRRAPSCVCVCLCVTCLDRLFNVGRWRWSCRSFVPASPNGPRAPKASPLGPQSLVSWQSNAQRSFRRPRQLSHAIIHTPTRCKYGYWACCWACWASSRHCQRKGRSCWWCWRSRARGASTRTSGATWRVSAQPYTHTIWRTDIAQPEASTSPSTRRKTNRSPSSSMASPPTPTCCSCPRSRKVSGPPSPRT